MKLAATLLYLALITPAYGQDQAKNNEEAIATLNQVTTRLLAKYRIQGIGIVGVRNENIVYARGFGTADGHHAFDNNTRFYIASNTKSFTGLAMAALVEEGRVGLDDAVTKFIPDHYFPASIDIGDVTVRDLLAHTTGLVDDALISRTAYSGEVPDDLRTLLRFTEYRTDDHSKAFRYSNLGYILSGIVIKEVTGQPWQDYVKNKLLTPAGLPHTSALVPLEDANASLPFEAGAAQPMEFRKTASTMHAAGGLYSTLPDMGHWLTLFTDQDQTRLPARYIAQASTELVNGIDQGMGPFKLSGYGYGWIHGSVWGTPLRFHFGSFPGYESMISYAPEDGLGVFVYVNERKGGIRVAAALSALYFDLMRNDPNYEDHLSNLEKMIASTYADDEQSPLAPLTRVEAPGLCGHYYSDDYGDLTISDSSAGYMVRLGDLRSKAYRGESDTELQVAWIPGKVESFNIKHVDGNTVLQYGDFDDFVRRMDDTSNCPTKAPSAAEGE